MDVVIIVIDSCGENERRRRSPDDMTVSLNPERAALIGATATTKIHTEPNNCGSGDESKKEQENRNFRGKPCCHGENLRLQRCCVAAF